MGRMLFFSLFMATNISDPENQRLCDGGREARFWSFFWTPLKMSFISGLPWTSWFKSAISVRKRRAEQKLCSHCFWRSGGSLVLGHTQFGKLIIVTSAEQKKYLPFILSLTFQIRRTRDYAMVVERLDFRVFLNHSLKCNLSQGSLERPYFKWAILIRKKRAEQKLFSHCFWRSGGSLVLGHTRFGKLLIVTSAEQKNVCLSARYQSITLQSNWEDTIVLLMLSIHARDQCHLEEELVSAGFFSLGKIHTTNKITRQHFRLKNSINNNDQSETGYVPSKHPILRMKKNLWSVFGILTFAQIFHDSLSAVFADVLWWICDWAAVEAKLLHGAAVGHTLGHFLQLGIVRNV